MLVADEELLAHRPRRAHLWLVSPSSRPTRSAPAISTPASGASRRSRSSSPSARSCRGRRRTSGAIATQSYANPRYGPDGLALLRDGPLGRRGRRAADRGRRRARTAPARRRRRRRAAPRRSRARSATTGPAAASGDGYAAQGNILVSGATVDALAETFDATAGRPLAERLLDCLDAAQAAGGDSRGQQSAALLVVERDGGYAGLSDTLVDLRVDDHAPARGARRLYRPPRSPVRQDTARRVARGRRRAPRRDRRAARRSSGMRRSTDWAGVENLEERVDGERRDRPGRARRRSGRRR